MIASSRDELKKLIQQHGGLCMSIFMPTHPRGAETQQDPIRLKNLLHEAEKSLIERSVRSSEVEEFLQPARRLLEDGLFWRHQSTGLAIFVSASLFRNYCLPLDFQQLVVISDRFYIKPLLPLLTWGGRFYILAVSQNEIRFLEGTPYGAHEVDLEGVPASLAEALKYDDPEKQLQFHTRTPGGMGKRPAMFHGQGVGTDDTKDNILRYFRQVDNGLHRLLHDERSPLVLAGVDYLFPIYREANTYPCLVDEGIAGNPEEMSTDELHEKGWSIVELHFLKGQQEAVTLYRQLAGTGLASKDVKYIVPAAYHGRVETLFVALGIQRWGSFDRDTNMVHTYEEARPGAEDLLNFAAIQTLLNRGAIYAVEPDKMPDEAPMAAVFRY